MSTGDKIVFKDKKKENVNLTGGEVFLTDSDFAIILNPKNFANTILKIAKEENIEMSEDMAQLLVAQAYHEMGVTSSHLKQYKENGKLDNPEKFTKNVRVNKNLWGMNAASKRKNIYDGVRKTIDSANDLVGYAFYSDVLQAITDRLYWENYARGNDENTSPKNPISSEYNSPEEYAAALKTMGFYTADQGLYADSLKKHVNKIAPDFENFEYDEKDIQSIVDEILGPKVVTPENWVEGDPVPEGYEAQGEEGSQALFQIPGEQEDVVEESPAINWHNEEKRIVEIDGFYYQVPKEVDISGMNNIQILETAPLPVNEDGSPVDPDAVQEDVSPENWKPGDKVPEGYERQGNIIVSTQEPTFEEAPIVTEEEVEQPPAETIESDLPNVIKRRRKRKGYVDIDPLDLKKIPRKKSDSALINEALTNVDDATSDDDIKKLLEEDVTAAKETQLEEAIENQRAKDEIQADDVLIPQQIDSKGKTIEAQLMSEEEAKKKGLSYYTRQDFKDEGLDFPEAAKKPKTRKELRDDYLSYKKAGGDMKFKNWKERQIELQKDSKDDIILPTDNLIDIEEEQELDTFEQSKEQYLDSVPDDFVLVTQGLSDDGRNIEPGWISREEAEALGVSFQTKEEHYEDIEYQFGEDALSGVTPFSQKAIISDMPITGEGESPLITGGVEAPGTDQEMVWINSGQTIDGNTYNEGWMPKANADNVGLEYIPESEVPAYYAETYGQDSTIPDITNENWQSSIIPVDANDNLLNDNDNYFPSTDSDGNLTFDNIPNDAANKRKNNKELQNRFGKWAPTALTLAAGVYAATKAGKEFKPKDFPALSQHYKQRMADLKELAGKGFTAAERAKVQDEINESYRLGLKNMLSASAGNRGTYLAGVGALDANRATALLDLAAKDAELNRTNQELYGQALGKYEEIRLKKLQTERSEDMAMQLQNKAGAAKFASEAFKQVVQDIRYQQNYGPDTPFGKAKTKYYETLAGTDSKNYKDRMDRDMAIATQFGQLDPAGQSALASSLGLDETQAEYYINWDE